MHSQPRRILKLEPLERRDVPASFGNAWSDPLHLTASFVADGTAVQSDTSQLFSMLQAQSLSGAGQEIILRAIQTWVNVANINVGVVADGGQAFGTAGAAQGDPRFGDIRIGSVSLASNKLSRSHPNDVVAGTWAGDILINDNASFTQGQQAGGYDLYTVFLQEVGHTLGLDNSSSTSSVMFDDFQTARLGLSPQDIGAIQALYGARRADAFDLGGENGSFVTATAFGLYGHSGAASAYRVQVGDVTTASDQDYYQFTAGSSGWMTINLRTAGLSLLTSKLDLFSASMEQLGTQLAFDPLSGDLQLQFFAEAGETYFVRVAANADSYFQVGAYQLSIVPEGTGATEPSGPSPELDAALNEDFSTATPLPLVQQELDDGSSELSYQEAIYSPSDVDFYTFTVQPAQASAPILNVSVMNLDSSNFRPTVTLYDSSYQVVPTRIVTNEDGTYAIQVERTWTAGEQYYLKVEGGASAGPVLTGRYYLAVNFNHNRADIESLVSSTTLTNASPASFGELTLPEDQLVHLDISGNLTNGNGGVRMTITNANGAVVATLTAYGNETVTGKFWLAMGIYQVRYERVTRDGSTPANVTFTSKIKCLGDSIDPFEIDPNAPPLPPTVRPPVVGEPDLAWYYIDLTPPATPT